jgi:hypothetical protein
MTTTHHRLVLLVLMVVVGLTIAPAATMPAAAQSGSDTDDESFFDGAIGNATGSILAQAGAVAAGLSSGLARDADPYLGEDDRDAAAYASDATAEFNAESDDLQAYGNERLTFDTSVDTFRVCFADKESGSATRYVVLDAIDGNASNTRMLTPTEFADQEPNRTADYNILLDWYASKYAAEEIDEFATKFAETNENATQTYRSALVGQYGSGVQSDLWGDAPEGCPA